MKLKRNVRIYTSLFFLFILYIMTIPLSITSTPTASDKYDSLTVFKAFIIGEIKDPYFDNDFYFQVVDVYIIGIFWYDLGVPYFGRYHLNDSWFVWEAQYRGLNYLRILLNQSGITHVCGTITNADIYQP